ncbi:hypothetical protein [Clostridium sp. UBA7791]|uniref:hypothetical protein n=1 Tax=Clostridium sp. UBA7791 TaxID=1946379 RepID=UPI003216E717
MSIIKKFEEIKEIIDCFLVNILENDDNLVLDNQEEDEVVVFNTNINWYWSNRDNLEIHIWDGQNKILLPVTEVEEDEESLDRIYVGNLLLTVL